VKRPTAHRPHLPGLYKLDRLADESVALAEQIKAQVQVAARSGPTTRGKSTMTTE
jgi:hypothetical protein